MMYPDIPELKSSELRSIEAELAKDPICQGMEEHHEFASLVRSNKTEQLRRALALPQGFSRKADDILAQFRKISGIDEVKLYLFKEKELDPRESINNAVFRYQLGGDLAIFDEETEGWAIGLPATVFEQRNQNEALFLMGRAIWKELHEGIPYGLMLNLASPVGFWQRVKISRLLRFREIAANSLGLLFCRNVASASNALLHLQLGLDATAMQCNPGFFGTLDNIDSVDELELLSRNLPVIPAAPLYFYAMEQFAKTDMFQSKKVGHLASPPLSLEKYFKDIHRANDHIHPLLREMPQEDRQFRERFLILAQYLVAEADDVIMKEETQAIMRSIDPQVIEELEEEYDWVKGKDGNTLDVSKAVFFSTPLEVRARHAAEILFHCVKTSISDGDQCEQEVEAIEFLAENLEVELSDLFAINEKAKEMATAEMDEEEIIQV
jgi:hypothetical protein